MPEVRCSQSFIAFSQFGLYVPISKNLARKISFENRVQEPQQLSGAA
jgi:hypothetical protein